jgi:hypothetical protein
MKVTKPLTMNKTMSYTLLVRPTCDNHECQLSWSAVQVTWGWSWTHAHKSCGSQTRPTSKERNIESRLYMQRRLISGVCAALWSLNPYFSKTEGKIWRVLKLQITNISMHLWQTNSWIVQKREQWDSYCGRTSIKKNGDFRDVSGWQCTIQPWLFIFKFAGGVVKNWLLRGINGIFGILQSSAI